LFVVPEQPRTTGNWVTALRHEQGLVSLGHEVRLVATAGSVACLERQVEEFAPDLVHLLHAYRSGLPWLGCRQQANIPSAVSLTGTDLNHGMDSDEQGPQIRAVLEQTAAIIIQNRLTVDSFAAAHPSLSPRLHHLAPGVSLGADPYPLRQRNSIPASDIVFLLPAGIRPVKANLELLQLFDSVAEAAPFCRLLFCGSILDPNYGQHFLEALKERPWARYLGEIPAAAMASALREVDVILNHSVSEGLPNVLLEAAALGRPILARDIPGNRAAFTPEVNGLLYDSPESFIRQALAFARNTALRQRLTKPLQKFRTSVDEALQLERIYQGLATGLSRNSPSFEIVGCIPNAEI
jgi:glycosyltransferase involved in cell wall biosynthesis